MIAKSPLRRALNPCVLRRAGFSCRRNHRTLRKQCVAARQWRTTTQQCLSMRHTHLPVEKPENHLEKISEKKSHVKILKVELENSSNDSNDPKNPVSKVKNLWKGFTSVNPWNTWFLEKEKAVVAADEEYWNEALLPQEVELRAVVPEPWFWKATLLKLRIS